jgi:hypothetical protein
MLIQRFNQTFSSFIPYLNRGNKMSNPIKVI